MPSTAADPWPPPLRWRGPRLTRRDESAARRTGQAVRAEAIGYVAMVAFLSAYGLMIAGAAPVLQALLNLLGCGTAARYLARKRAIPNVICNIIWAVITLIGLIPR